MNTSKIFCIGLNKTGTTALGAKFEKLGYKVAPQRSGELLLDAYLDRKFKPIKKLSEKYSFFQDIPFSLPYTGLILSEHYPNSKFILTIRESAEEWANSLINFHRNMFKLSRNPTDLEVSQIKYVKKGYIHSMFRKCYDINTPDIYNLDELIRVYNFHIYLNTSYFKNNENFIIVNLADKNTSQKLGDFLKIKDFGEIDRLDSKDIIDKNYNLNFLK